MAGSIGNIAKNCSRFIIGTWAEPVGRQCYKATHAKSGAIKFFDFKWKDALYIAYFQAYTGTYASIDYLRSL